MSTNVKRIAVTGAAGQIAYSLLFCIANGDLLGKEQKIILKLLELPQSLDALRGVVMELEDCAFPLVEAIEISDDPHTASTMPTTHFWSVRDHAAKAWKGAICWQRMPRSSARKDKR